MSPPDVLEYLDAWAFQLVIDGQLTPASDMGTSETVDPSTGRRLAHVPLATREDVAAAVAAAKRAQPGWRGLGLQGRTELFEELATAVEERELELGMLDALDCGNPIGAMRTDIRRSAQQLRSWPRLAQGLRGETIPASEGNLHYTRHDPYGVVGRIVAFNHPGFFAITRVLAALITGNTVVMKPAPQTPLSALAFGEIAREVLPPGVLNVVTGGAETGDALVTDPRVKRLGFTGSVRTGMAIQQRAATVAVKHISLELGGKNAMIVMPDVSVDAVADGAVKGMNLDVCQGQSCGSNSRVFVHESLYQEVLDAIADRVARVRVGPAWDESTDMGPLVSEDHRERVRSYVASGQAAGARLIVGGGDADGPEPGFYFEPTVFGDVDMDMAIARDEIFGPVMSVLPWRDYDDVVERANALEYGLTASVWTNDLHLAHKTADRLEAGYIWINDSSTHYWGTPFGGYKNSGIGREEYEGELLSYLETKSVHTIMRDPVVALNSLRRDVS